MTFVAYVFVAVDASILGCLGPAKRGQMSLSCSGARWLCEQGVVAMEASLARYVLEDPLAYPFDVVLPAKEVLVTILGALVRFCQQMREEVVLGR